MTVWIYDDGDDMSTDDSWLPVDAAILARMSADASYTDAERGVHLHLDDYPATLAFLTLLFERKVVNDPGGLADIGYQPTEHGAWVDWDRLLESWMSSTEKALVHIARGAAILEYHGGPPPSLAAPLLNLAAAVTIVDGRPLATWHITTAAADE